MSLSRHAARAVRVIGTSAAAAVLSVTAAQTALACDISDFSAAPACDAQGNGVIRVTDKDPSGTPAKVTLLVVLNSPGQMRSVDTRTIEHSTAQGVSVDLHPLDALYPGQNFVVHVTVDGRFDSDLDPRVVVPDDFTCTPSGGASASVSASAPASASPSDSSSASAPPSTPPSAEPSATPTAAHSGSAAPAASGAPSPAGGGTHLAETGGGDHTLAFAGAAAALVVAGGGTVLALRRKGASQSR